MPVIDILAKHASLTPDRIAISIAGNEITYKILYQRAEAFRRKLFNLEKRHPDHFGLPDEGRLVLLALPNHFRFGEIFVGGSASPHCVAVLSVATPPNQIEEIMRRLNPDLVICENKGCVIAKIARALDLPALYVEKDADTQSTYDRFLATYDRFLATYDRFLEGTIPDKTIADLPLGSFFIGFTSGTTGLPKAFIRNRQSWRNSLVPGREFFGLGKLHKTVAPGPMAHGVSLYALIETLDSGQTFESVRKFNVDDVLELLKTADRFVGVPTMLNELKRRADERKLVFTEMKQLVTGASKFDRQHYADACALFPNAEILQYYGASELSFVAVNKMTPRTLSHENSMSPVGKPFPGVKVTIRDENLLPLTPDKIGTIFVESDLISDGYLWGDNGKAFVRNRYGATVGDLGMIDKNGELYVMGRAGGMIISGGNNIYLAEIETALKTIPNISEAIAFGIADDIYGERLVSVISFKDAPLTADELREFCRPLMEKFKIPKDFYMINHWPMTWSGKIARVIVNRMVEEGAPEVTRL